MSKAFTCARRPERPLGEGRPKLSEVEILITSVSKGYTYAEFSRLSFPLDLMPDACGSPMRSLCAANSSFAICQRLRMDPRNEQIVLRVPSRIRTLKSTVSRH